MNIIWQYVNMAIMAIWHIGLWQYQKYSSDRSNHAISSWKLALVYIIIWKLNNSKTNDLGIIVKLIQFSTYFFKLDSYCRKKLSKLANNKCGMLYVFSMQIAEIKFYMISAILGSSIIIYEKQEVNHEWKNKKLDIVST